MWLDRLLSNPTTDALTLSAQFAEQRQRVLAENVANIDTPDYRSKRLDPASFQSALREALDAREPGSRTPLHLSGNAQVSTTPAGALETRPATEPAPNVLFHDGTNARLEALMSDVLGNTLEHEFALNLLRNRFESLQSAIRGRNT